MSPRWVPRGPSCVTNAQLGAVTREIDGLGRAVCSGRVAAIGLSPDGKTIYAGAASGGVWQSRDDGAHWVPLMDDQPTLAVGAIAVADEHTVYVGTGEYNDNHSGDGVMTGVGILFSDHEGRSWELLWHDVLARTRIARIVVHPTRRDEIYAATSAGLFIATSRTSFHLFELGIPTFHACTDVAVDFTDPDAPIVYAAVLANGIHRLTGTPLDTSRPVADRFHDPGAMPLTRFPGLPSDPNLQRITLALANPPHAATLYAAFCDETDLIGLYRSDTGGQDWTPYGTTFGPTGSGTYMLVLAVDPADPGLVFYGDTRLWRRAGAAQPWQLVSPHRGDYPGVHDDQHALAFDRASPGVLWLGNDGGIWKSVDGGRHFDPRNRGLATAQLYSLAQFPDEPVLLAGTQDLGAISTRGHPAWTELFGGDGFYTAIEPKSPRFWYGGYDPARAPIYRYSAADDRFTWKVVKNGFDDSIAQLQRVFFVADPHTAGVLYAGSNALFWTRDHGDRWDRIDKTLQPGSFFPITAIAVAPTDPSVVYYGRTTGEVARIQRTGDDAWTDPAISTAISAPGEDEHCAALAVDPSDPNVLYAVVGTATGPDADDSDIPHRIWRGTYDGHVLDLQPFADLPDDPVAGVPAPHGLNHVNALALDPAHAGVLYVGTDVGVYRWTGHWERFSDHLPAAAVITGMVLDDASRRLRVSTLGRGVWECLLDGPERTVDLYVRDCELDDGTRPTLAERQHPVSLGVQRWTDGPDLKLDTDRAVFGGFASPTRIGYDGTGEVDYLGFEALGSDNARGGAVSRVYVQVHNRGPDKAGEVDVRLFWAKKDGAAFPDLPPDFWARHLEDTFDTTHWKPLGGAQKIIDLEPTAPRVARFDWTASGSNDTIGILAVVSSAQDPLPAGLTLAVESAVRADKHLALRECTVNPATYKIVLEVLAVVGLVVLAAVEGPKLL